MEESVQEGKERSGWSPWYLNKLNEHAYPETEVVK